MLGHFPPRNNLLMYSANMQSNTVRSINNWDIDTILIFLALYTITMDLK